MNSCATPTHIRPLTAALPLSHRPVQPLTDDKLYSQLFDAILEQRIGPDSRFTPQSLAQLFGAPCSMTRRVLTRLAHQQVVILRPNHRPTITTTDLEHTRQILQARRLAESTIVQLFCQQRRPEAIDRLRKSIRQQQRCATRQCHGPAIRLSGEFHLTLAELAGNNPLTQFLGGLVALTSLVIAQRAVLVDHQWTIYCHTRITDALEQSDHEQAAELMLGYLRELEILVFI